MHMHMHMHMQVSNHPVLKDGPISTSLIQMIDEARGVAWTIR